MQDHTKEVNRCGPNGLRGEEAVGLGGDAGANGGGLLGEVGGAAGDYIWEALDDESEVGECGGDGGGGAAGGAADLGVGCNPVF